MPSLSSRLGLKRPLTTDSFATQDIYDNYTVLDGYPGAYICTSSTRPSTWGAAHTGMQIYETDTLLMWRWTGSAFARVRPTGMLGAADLSADFSSAATTPTSTSPATLALSVSVTVPATTTGSTTRRIKVTANMFRVYSTLGACSVSLYREGGSPFALMNLSVRGKPATDPDPMNWGDGKCIVGYDTPAVAGGTITYGLHLSCFAAVGGTATINAAAIAKTTLTVEEVGV